MASSTPPVKDLKTVAEETEKAISSFVRSKIDYKNFEQKIMDEKSKDRAIYTGRDFQVFEPKGILDETKKLNDSIKSPPPEVKISKPNTDFVNALEKLDESVKISYFNIAKGHPQQEQVARITKAIEEASKKLDELKPAPLSTPPTEEEKKNHAFWNEQKAAFDKLQTTVLIQDLEKLKKDAEDQTKAALETVAHGDRSIKTISKKAELFTQDEKLIAYNWWNYQDAPPDPNEPALSITPAGDDFAREMDKLAKTNAKYFKRESSDFTIEFDPKTGKGHPRGIHDPDNAVKRGQWDRETAVNNFLKGWEEYMLFLSMKMRATSLDLSIDTDVIKDEKSQKEYLGYLLALQKRGEEMGLKINIGNPHDKDDKTRALINKFYGTSPDPKHTSLNNKDGMRIQKVVAGVSGYVGSDFSNYVGSDNEKEVGAQLVRVVNAQNERLAKEAQEKAKKGKDPIKPEAIMKFTKEEHIKNLKEDKISIETPPAKLDSEPAVEERLKKLSDSFKKLSDASGEMERALKDNSLSAYEKGKLDEMMKAMKEQQAELTKQYKACCDQVEKLPDTPKKKELQDLALDGLKKVLGESALPTVASGQSPSVATQERDLIATKPLQEQLAYYEKLISNPEEHKLPPSALDGTSADSVILERELRTRLEKMESAVEALDAASNRGTPLSPEENKGVENIKTAIKTEHDKFQQRYLETITKVDAPAAQVLESMVTDIDKLTTNLTSAGVAVSPLPDDKRPTIATALKT